ncbi:hypothetical protein HanHA300_Chr17g0672101 [Helianthus annuus]|nr:hypothetical protein HanHA300_Chr17g0672101 [Helianthus annuus]KAJ0634018.1 hypothetical protein HanLR1_Chr17g0683361 [Helianthus annuus]
MKLCWHKIVFITCYKIVFIKLFSSQLMTEDTRAALYVALPVLSRGKKWSWCTVHGGMVYLCQLCIEEVIFPQAESAGKSEFNLFISLGQTGRKASKVYILDIKPSKLSLN